MKIFLVRKVLGSRVAGKRSFFFPQNEILVIKNAIKNLNTTPDSFHLLFLHLNYHFGPSFYENIKYNLQTINKAATIVSQLEICLKFKSIRGGGGIRMTVLCTK